VSTLRRRASPHAWTPRNCAVSTGACFNVGEHNFLLQSVSNITTTYTFNAHICTLRTRTELLTFGPDDHALVTYFPRVSQAQNSFITVHLITKFRTCRRTGHGCRQLSDTSQHSTLQQALCSIGDGNADVATDNHDQPELLCPQY
jgi:hypothetical protein